MFSHLKNLELVHLNNNICINQNFENAMNQMEKLEDSLRICSTGFGVYNRIAKDFGQIRWAIKFVSKLIQWSRENSTFNIYC